MAKLSDERLTCMLANAEELAEMGHNFVLDPAEVIALASELRAYRAGEIAQPGQVLVAEGDLRALVDFYGRQQGDCIGCIIEDSCAELLSLPEFLEVDETACLAALLAHFGLEEVHDGQPHA